MSKSRLMAAVGAGAAIALLAAPMIAAAAPAAPDPAAIGRIRSDLPVGIQIGVSRIVKDLSNAYRGLPGGNLTKDEQAIVFYDAEGRPLYTPADGGACAGDCLKNWRPAAAPAGAAGIGGFTVANGQWAFRGKPLYVAVSGPKLGDPYPFVDDTEVLQPQYPMGLAVRDNLDGMRLARLAPKTWMDLPYSIGVAEYRLVPGQILASGIGAANPMGKALYAFTGTPEQEKALPGMFKPEEASVLSLPIGDFSIRERPDGMRQWAYKGAPLFTCTCDITTGSIEGEGKVPSMAPALVYSYAVPQEVTYRRDNLAIGRMVEARTGKTLYFRDRLQDDYTPDHARPMFGTINPQVAALLGVNHCDAACEKDWKPLLAAKNAQPVGYWTIYDRPDGKRQWAYKNAAVYTHVKEAPGSLDGNETYTVEFEDGHGGKAMPKEFGLGMAWRAIVP